MYISKKELLKIAKDNKLRGCVDYTKPQLFTRLRSEGLLPEGVNENDKDPDRYNFLKGIKDRTKKVEVRDLESVLFSVTHIQGNEMVQNCRGFFIE